MKYKAYIFGAGEIYNKMAAVFRSFEKDISFLGIIVSSVSDNYLYSIDGLNIFDAKSISYDEIDLVIIAIEKWREAYDLLIRLGVDENKIIRWHVFMLPYFNLDNYILLRNKPTTILCNQCLAGIVYKELGLKSYSPTINCFCEGESFVKFIENYKSLLDRDIEEATDDNNSFMFKGQVGDVIWNFNHARSMSDALNTWNEKRLRIVDNVSVIFVTYSIEAALRMCEFEMNKIVFLPVKEYDASLPREIIQDLDWLNDISLRQTYHFSWGSYCNEKYSNVVKIGSPIDWISFLLKKEDYLRCKNKYLNLCEGGK